MKRYFSRTIWTRAWAIDKSVNAFWFMGNRGFFGQDLLATSILIFTHETHWFWLQKRFDYFARFIRNSFTAWTFLDIFSFCVATISTNLMHRRTSVPLKTFASFWTTFTNVTFQFFSQNLTNFGFWTWSHFRRLTRIFCEMAIGAPVKWKCKQTAKFECKLQITQPFKLCNQNLEMPKVSQRYLLFVVLVNLTPVFPRFWVNLIFECPILAYLARFLTTFRIRNCTKNVKSLNSFIFERKHFK